MNHLAHFHLAGDRPGHLAGALLADYLRGPLRGELPPDVEAGVRLHRRIDAVTDSHPVVIGLRRLFGPGERRLAGIVLDLHFDRCLARGWDRYDQRALAAYSRGIYAVLREHSALLPAAGRLHAARIEQYDLLRRYAEEEIVEGALRRIGTRLGRERDMDRAIAVARREVAAIEDGFLALYPALQAMAREFRASVA